jgi:hypothetical protein
VSRQAASLNAPERTALERNIGADRLAGYMASTGGDAVSALDLYLWNTSVSAACFEDLSLLEVALRNACHEQLRRWHAAQGHVTPWYFMTGLEPRHMADIAQARQRVQQGRNEETEGRVVSELTLGFWRLLHAKVYEHTLWKDVLRFAYPYQPASDRGQVYSHLDHVNTLRNRIAHHEPVHRSTIGRTALDLAAIHAELLDVVEWIDRDLHAWLLAESRVPGLLASKPGLSGNVQ